MRFGLIRLCIGVIIHLYERVVVEGFAAVGGGDLSADCGAGEGTGGGGEIEGGGVFAGGEGGGGGGGGGGGERGGGGVWGGGGGGGGGAGDQPDDGVEGVFD